MRLRARRGMVVALLAALAAAAAGLAPDGIGPLDGLVYDLALAAAARRPGTGGEPVAVIALDRGSLAADELADLPRVFLSPVWAKVTNALMDADARAIGFDIIFSYSANRFAKLDGQYDREFLAAIARARGHIVLARSAGAYPAPSFVAALFDPKADAGKAEPTGLGFAELSPDADGVVRRVPAQVEAADGEALTSFSAALLSRIPGASVPPEIRLAPARPLEAMPAYSLIDVLRCAGRDPEALRQAFAGKVVLIGTTLPEEDRKRAPDRFMTPPPAAKAKPGGCGLRRLGASAPGRGTTPGVFVHAAAIESVLTGNLVRPVPAAGRAIAAGAVAAGGAALGFLLPPVLATLAVAALAGLCLAAVPLLLGYGLWLPAALPAAAAIGAMVVAYIVRFVIENRRRRRVQRAFGHYLAPALVDRLSDGDAPLRLGGEERDVTVMFADLSGFTALSGVLGPSELMAVTNAYLAIIVAAVEATGGYVDKFIGDAVMGIWGAPAPQPDHAALAARAALAAVAGVMRSKADAEAAGRRGYAVKIGLNSGRAVVGNVGAERRFNYTAVGETVNIAARLESVPEDYGCRIVLGPETAAAVADRFVVNELDWVKVKGKAEKLSVYELVAARDGAGAAALAYPERYRAALDRYRAGAFAEAETGWRETAHPYLAAVSPPLAMAGRAAALAADPPADWDGVYVRTTK